MADNFDIWAILLPIFENLREAIKSAHEGLASGNARQVEQLNEQLRRDLLVLKDELRMASSSELCTHYIFFALICTLDEMALGRLRGRPTLWKPLQVLLLGTDDGGENFFRELDSALYVHSGRVSTVVYEVFLYCLLLGFKGAHVDNPAALRRYRSQLLPHIGQDTKLLMDRMGADLPEFAWSDGIPWRVWGWAVVAVVLVHAGIVLWWRL